MNLYTPLFWLIRALGGSVTPLSTSPQWVPPSTPRSPTENPQKGMDPADFPPGTRFHKIQGERIPGTKKWTVTQSEIDKVPDGALYIAPNGRVYRK